VTTKTIPAPESPTMMQARMICGIVCVLGGVLCLLALLVVSASAGRMDLRLLAAMAIHFTNGVMLFSTSPVAQLREKRLAERAAAPAEKKEEYVEVPPRISDIAQISLLTGILSWVSVPVVFGPAAIVSGVLAVSRGHLSGLVGMILGLVGVVGWAVVFTMLGPSGRP
jgi:hypothetical protein